MPKQLYFAHPVNTYNTDLEKRLLEVIAHQFYGCDIINPSRPKHQRGYERWNRELRNGMGYFFHEILPSCNLAVFLAFADGMLGAETASKVERFFDMHLPVWEIFPDGKIVSVHELDGERKLSVKETEKRVRDEESNLVPY